jgi:RNA polymerase sigma factor (TIGR02999 family)
LTELTLLIQRAASGDRAAFDSAFLAIAMELRALAQRRLLADAGGTLSATALVHETWLKLSGRAVSAQNRVHFFRIAAAAMRQIWIDHRRSRAAEQARIRLYVDATPDPGAIGAVSEDWTDLVDWELALRVLERDDPDGADLVALRVFSGLDLEEIAALRGVSLRTVQRHWRAARAFLLQV